MNKPVVLILQGSVRKNRPLNLEFPFEMKSLARMLDEAGSEAQSTSHGDISKLHWRL
ncbi:hypothetical protein SNOG_20180 [Parastagonospora nodorum SN15]|uniref:Uncharacterized protein n=1 Tax=Phaeosphaeria nodorum (strain SN15 / ATCC MYA-4574 / FGSC 10173) TaxID=321614 RepID=A9JXH6_PHANO|nr:hypothetical protein SNOG_20180 [Parastagonospora nodorum SN15]EDP89882.1 hypothetical protein SNOG_20180 [Parastagonospora nodorum SN15]